MCKPKLFFCVQILCIFTETKIKDPDLSDGSLKFKSERNISYVPLPLALRGNFDSTKPGFKA